MIRLDKYKKENTAESYSVFLYGGCTVKFSNLKETQKFLVKVSKDLNACYASINEVYRQIVFASQPFIFQLEKDYRLYNELKSKIDERMWFSLRLYGGQSNHFYFHIIMLISEFLKEMMVLVTSCCRLKNMVLEETFKTSRMVLEAEIFKLRTTYKITQLETEATEREFNEVFTAIYRSA